MRTLVLSGSNMNQAFEKTKEFLNSNGYKAFYQDKEADIYADTLYQAKLKAIAHFKAPKSKEYLVSVHLCELNGKQVTHVADF